MVAIATGLWWDHSKSAASAATLTLSMTTSNFLLSALAFLVTLAGASAWSITAFILHAIKTRHGSEQAHAIDLMHQVCLRNSGGAVSTFWETIKIYFAWSRSNSKSGQDKKHPHILQKTLFVALPATLVWVSFAVAALFTSSVANKAYGNTIARIKEQSCGFWMFDNDTDEGEVAALIRNTNDTIAGRSYVNSFYANTSTASTARSPFVVSSLPYTTSASESCPIPDSKRCRGGIDSAFSMTTDLLDSHTMLGINARAEDRVALRMKATCSPVTPAPYTDTSEIEGATFVNFYLGPAVSAGTNYTYRHKLDTERSGIGYTITSRYAYSRGEGSSWEPIAQFSRNDADMSVYFLSSNVVAYLTPVYDTWFSASGNNTVPYGDRNAWQYDYLVNTLVCAEQYQLCNPTTSVCSPLGGKRDLGSWILIGNRLALNPAQLLSAARLFVAVSATSTYSVVANLGVSSLWANSKLFNNILSTGLPPNQWQIEVLGWFQTTLAMVQAAIVEFASNDNGVTPYAIPSTNAALRPVMNNVKEYREGCKTQLVQTAGEVQNFDLLGVLIIICISILLIFLQLTIEPLVDLVKFRSGWQSPSKKARQADSNLHLLRMVLAGTKQSDAAWERGPLDVPVLAQDAAFERPEVVKKLTSYGTAAKLTEVTHLPEQKRDVTAS